jgi:tetratricopeptide (TPR) repeat protein
MTLSRNLDTLEYAGLIHLLVTAPELEYLFRHALVQEATYHTLVRTDRKRLHRSVGDALERLYPQPGVEFAPVLAHHFAQAGEAARALPYCVAAGEHAMRRYANAEAAMHFGRAIEMANQTAATGQQTAVGNQASAVSGQQTSISSEVSVILHPPSAAVPLPSLAELYARRGRALELCGQFAEAFATYGAMRAEAQRRGDRTMELAALALLAQTRSTPNPLFDANEGEALTREALQWARELGDRQAEVKVLWNRVNLAVLTGRMDQGLRDGEQAMRLARELGLRELLAYILNDIWRAYGTVGDWEQAIAVVSEASTIWREVGNLPMLTDSLSTLAQGYLFSGMYDEALRFAAEAREISRATHNRWGESYSQFAEGRIHWDRGDPARAVEVMGNSIRLGEEAGFIVPQLFTRAELALVVATMGNVAQGIALAEQAAELARAQMMAFLPQPMAVLVLLRLVRGELVEAEAALREAQVSFETQNALVRPVVHQATVTYLLTRGDWAQALQAADAMIEYLKHGGIRHMLAEALLLKGRALLGSGRNVEARAAFDEAMLEAKRLGAKRLEREIQEAMRALSEGESSWHTKNAKDLENHKSA